jgi:antitoxin MazE
METKLQKWGNSLAIRLPKQVTNKLALREGSPVTVAEDHGEIVIRQAPHAKVSLRSLVSKITSKNRHAEVAWGEASGQEVW